MYWHHLRNGLLGLTLVWSALFPFAAEAMARVSGDESWLLCAPQVRGELSDENAANLAILAELSGASGTDDATALVPVCDDCLTCPAVAPPAATVTAWVPREPEAFFQDRHTGRLGANKQPGLRPDVRGPPRPDQETA